MACFWSGSYCYTVWPSRLGQSLSGPPFFSCLPSHKKKTAQINFVPEVMARPCTTSYCRVHPPRAVKASVGALPLITRHWHDPPRLVPCRADERGGESVLAVAASTRLVITDVPWRRRRITLPAASSHPDALERTRPRPSASRGWAGDQHRQAIISVCLLRSVEYACFHSLLVSKRVGRNIHMYDDEGSSTDVCTLFYIHPSS